MTLSTTADPTSLDMDVAFEGATDTPGQAIGTSLAPDAGAVQPSAGPTKEQVRRAFESGRYPYPRKLSRRTYEADKAKLQAELLKVQLWGQETGQKFVLLFEGRDAAGNSG